MKKAYIRPTATTVELFAKESLLVGSSFDVDKGDDTNTAFSNKKSGWSSDDWASGAEE